MHMILGLGFIFIKKRTFVLPYGNHWRKWVNEAIIVVTDIEAELRMTQSKNGET